jgi:hypothetical protein
MKPEIPPDYSRAVEDMVRIIRAAVAAGFAPAFVMPPDNILFAAPLDVVGDRCCNNDDARFIVSGLCGQIRGVEGDGPTVFMLRCALQIAQVKYESAHLSHFIPPGSKLAGFPARGGKA